MEGRQAKPLPVVAENVPLLRVMTERPDAPQAGHDDSLRRVAGAGRCSFCLQAKPADARTVTGRGFKATAPQGFSCRPAQRVNPFYPRPPPAAEA